jgi:hypothetical protein
VAHAILAPLRAAFIAHPVDLHAYCWLPGHYHVLVRADLTSLRAALAQFESESGFLPAEAPRAVPVAFGRHLLTVSRYIHLNPVDAGLAWRPENWPYSSFRAYLGDREAPRWILTDALLGRFGSVGARHRHRAYVYAGMDPGTRDADGRPRWASLFGPGTSAEDEAWRVEPVLLPQPWPHPVERRGPTLSRLTQEIAQAFQVPEAALRSVRTGGPTAARARGALLHAARSLGGHRLRDVAAWMNYASPAAAAAAAERFERAARLDPA